MQAISEFIITFGYIGIFTTIFAESGFLLGFFLPGDSLLFTVGILASQGIFNIWLLVSLTMIAAVLGDSFGYYIGHKFGPKIFNREESIIFKKEYVTTTEEFYKKHGKKTIILARFVPIVRTFAPIMAGVGKMEYKTFLAYNIIGATLWAGGITLLGYWLGQFEWVEHYLEYVIIAIILISFIPVVVEFIKNRIKNKE